MEVLDYIILGLKIVAGVVAIPTIGSWLIVKIDDCLKKWGEWILL